MAYLSFHCRRLGVAFEITLGGQKPDNFSLNSLGFLFFKERLLCDRNGYGALYICWERGIVSQDVLPVVIVYLDVLFLREDFEVPKFLCFLWKVHIKDLGIEVNYFRHGHFLDSFLKEVRKL